ncbi:Hsp20/alpha crystallin family protein [Crassaminicella thermophila]|uniref:Hsp20/alpha crystallin family protein n=1 Tax=Crassaminicella thermophila TaxID=2599308 RepID=A0A5C0SAP4_CRATE|nr:heat shock protein Hsp18 [Crassaminicella thermophila]QEK11645.1 Hsp20/alpha crystallin family protein [Crassaminicella thermophila]
MFGMVPFKRNNSLEKRNDYFNQLFNNFFDDDFFAPMITFGNAFKVDLKETENEYTIEADLPGINKEAIDIDYENNYLTIRAKREETIENENNNYVRRERSYGEFKRRFYIDNVNEEKINASFKNGVLKITLPKLEKSKVHKRKIDIH